MRKEIKQVRHAYRVLTRRRITIYSLAILNVLMILRYWKGPGK